MAGSHEETALLDRAKALHALLRDRTGEDTYYNGNNKDGDAAESDEALYLEVAEKSLRDKLLARARVYFNGAKRAMPQSLSRPTDKWDLVINEYVSPAIDAVCVEDVPGEVWQVRALCAFGMFYSRTMSMPHWTVEGMSPSNNISLRDAIVVVENH